jgi:hypothetical protein
VQSTVLMHLCDIVSLMHSPFSAKERSPRTKMYGTGIPSPPVRTAVPLVMAVRARLIPFASRLQSIVRRPSDQWRTNLRLCTELQRSASEHHRAGLHPRRMTSTGQNGADSHRCIYSNRQYRSGLPRIAASVHWASLQRSARICATHVPTPTRSIHGVNETFSQRGFHWHSKS